MLHKVNFSWLALILSVLIFAGCAGDEDEDLPSFLDVTDQRLSSLELIAGGVLSLNGSVLEEFNPDEIGPYSVELSDEALDSITLRATPVLATSTLTLIEVGKEEDNTSKFTDIVAGEDFVAEITPGVNLIFIRVSNESTGANADYYIQVNRVSSSADIAAAQILVYTDLSLNIAQLVSLEPEFDPEITDYTATIDAAFCEVEISIARDSLFADARINGESLTSDFVLVNEGENTIVVDIESEDGSETKQYNFTVTREAASDDEIAADPRLKSMTFSEGRELFTGFRCTGNQVSQFVTNAVTSIGLTLETERENVAISFGNATLDEDSGFPDFENSLWLSENDVELTSGVEYSGELLADLVVGANYFVITTTSTSEASLSNFLVNIFRSENNEVFVSNAEELQDALKNAVPNDDIVLSAGDYLGVVGEAQSGSAEAHFFADADGTAEEPIKLRAAESGVRLLGDDLSQNTVLLLQGDYWEVSGIEVSGAQNGVVLDGSSSGLYGNIDINNIGERGFSILNGSANNEFSFSEINNTGLLPQTRENISEVFGEALVVGGGDLASDGNAIRNIVFGKNNTEAIDIKENASNSIVQYSIFAFDNTLSQAIEDRSIISVAGSSNEISSNQFDYDNITSGNDDVEQVVNITAAAGSSSAISQNTFSLDGQTITAVNNAGEGTVLIGGNKDEGGGELQFDGTFDSSFINPIYQIQSTLDPTQCLAQREVVLGDNIESNLLVVADDCVDEPEQRWEFIHDSDGFVFIAQTSNLDNKIFGTISSVTPSLIGMREDSGSVFDDAFSLRWTVQIFGDEVRFASKLSESYFITETDGDTFENTDIVTPIRLEVASDLSNRVFTLIRLN